MREKYNVYEKIECLKKGKKPFHDMSPDRGPFPLRMSEERNILREILDYRKKNNKK